MMDRPDYPGSGGAAGDEYRATDIHRTKAGATVLGALCGGVVQNTPYLGHPAYKAMGARAGYTFATGLVIGGGAPPGPPSPPPPGAPRTAPAPLPPLFCLRRQAPRVPPSPPPPAGARAPPLRPVAPA